VCCGAPRRGLAGSAPRSSRKRIAVSISERVKRPVRRGNAMQHGCLHVEAGNDGVDVGSLREDKIHHLEPVVNAREAQRLAEDVRACPLTAERRLPALLGLLPIPAGESAGTGLERAVGVKPALYHIELTQAGSKA